MSSLRNSWYQGELAIAGKRSTDMNRNLFEFQLPTRVHEAMQMQVEAERKKRAAILESEGIREADINVAEGKRQSRILASGSFFTKKQPQQQFDFYFDAVNCSFCRGSANGTNQSCQWWGSGFVGGRRSTSKRLKHHRRFVSVFANGHSFIDFYWLWILANCRLAKKDGKNAASFFVAEQYVEAFNKLARTNNTLILPSNVGNISSLVGEAMSIYSQITKANDSNALASAASDSTSINSDSSNQTDYNSNNSETTSKSSPDSHLS